MCRRISLKISGLRMLNSIALIRFRGLVVFRWNHGLGRSMRIRLSPDLTTSVPYGDPPNGGGKSINTLRCPVDIRRRSRVVSKCNHQRRLFRLHQSPNQGRNRASPPPPLNILLNVSLTYTGSQRGLYPNTGTFEWSDIHLKNFTGNANGERIVEIYCSKANPCFDWTFEDINIKPNGTDRPDVNYVCNNMVMDWENGLDGCHPGEPGYQSEQFLYHEMEEGKV